MHTQIEKHMAADAVCNDYVSQTMLSSLQSMYNRLNTAPLGGEATAMNASPASFTLHNRGKRHRFQDGVLTSHGNTAVFVGAPASIITSLRARFFRVL
jgi:hypothetical protein